MIKKTDIVIVMPAYNAEKTLEKTYKDIPTKLKSCVILVDDKSHDHTVEVAKGLGIKTQVHQVNKGYGGNQKTCYKLAINQKPKVVVMVHPDYQYDSSLILELVKPILDKHFDIMLGSRIHGRTQALSGGMPLYKYFFNRFLTLAENIYLGQNLSEYHTGFRAFNSKVLKKIQFQKFSNDFVFDQQILISAIKNGFKVGETQVPVRYFPDASSINFIRSVKYGIETLYYLLILK